MRTQVMHESVAATPWLEYYPPNSSRPERKLLESFPFVIGRVESVDLQILSSKVSREHAAVLHDNHVFTIRDLGSTNGTFVNGSKIDEAPLRDGDIVTIADVEVTLRIPSSKVSEATATQVIEHSRVDTRTGQPDLVQELRRYRETLLRRAQRVGFERIIALDSDEVFGFEAVVRDDDSVDTRLKRMLHATECRLVERLQQQYRLLAAEQASHLENPSHVFFRLHTFEIGADGLTDSLRSLRDVLGSVHQIVVEIPDSAVCDIPFFRGFLEQLREFDVLIAHDGFHGSESQLLDKSDLAPDFLKLAPTMVQGITRNSGGQQQVQSIVRAARQLNCGVIAVGVRSDEEAETFKGLGCQFAQGEGWGRSSGVLSGRSHPAVAG